MATRQLSFAGSCELDLCCSTVKLSHQQRLCEASDSQITAVRPQSRQKVQVGSKTLLRIEVRFGYKGRSLAILGWKCASEVQTAESP